MQSLRICNIKSIKDSGVIELKPITALVGKNSSGKSSFIRTLPLLRQSVESFISGPISFSDRLVDFGEIEEIKNRALRKTPVELTMSYSGLASYYRSPFSRNINVRDVAFTISMKIDGKSYDNYATEISIKIYDHNITLTISNNCVTLIQINKNKFVMDKDKIQCSYSNCIIPTITLKKYIDYGILVSSYSLSKYEIFTKYAVELIQGYASKRITREKIEDFVRKIEFDSSAGLIDTIKNTNLLGAVFKNHINELTQSKIESLVDSIILSHVCSLVDNVAYFLNEECKCIYYVGPIRSIAARYYRLQNKSVVDLESDGSNVPVFINSLDRNAKESLNDFIHKYLGFRIKMSTQRGFATIQLYENDSKKSSNLLDVGFGFSQILPIVVNLWTITRQSETSKRPSTRAHKSFIFTVEQPELHLHPEMQAKLIDAYIRLISELKKSGISLKIIFETHSQTMITRLGYNVSKGNLPRNDVAVYLFDTSSRNGYTKIQKAEFLAKGQLANWPRGFFIPEM